MDLIAVTRKGASAFEFRVRRHAVTLDMTETEGGRDAGPRPVEMMAGSLGACIAIMVQRYCDARGYKDGDVAVHLTTEMADDPKRVGAFVVDLQLPKDVPEEKRAAIRRVVDLCPVHATMARAPRLDLEFA